MAEILFKRENTKKSMKEPLMKNEKINYLDFESKKKFRNLGRNRSSSLFFNLFLLRTYFDATFIIDFESFIHRNRSGGNFRAYIRRHGKPTYFTYFFRKNNRNIFDNELFNFDDLDSKKIKSFLF